MGPGSRWTEASRDNLEKGAENSPADYEMTLDFVREEGGLLEWTATVNDGKTYSFVKHMQVDGKDYTCKNNDMVGSGNPAEHERAMKACDTLKKK